MCKKAALPPVVSCKPLKNNRKAIPPPITRVLPSGDIETIFPPAISGSGIRNAVSSSGIEPGSIFLAAPEGVIDAGDAGIVTAGDFFAAANDVIGADNIDVGGVSVGVPTDNSGLGASLTGVSDTGASAAKSAQELTKDTTSEDSSEEGLGETALAWLEVFVLGFGEEEEIN